MKITINEWVVNVAERDCHDSFERLYRYFSPGLLTYVTTLTNDREAAGDLVQDLFFAIWTNRRSLSAVGNIGHYLYSSIKNNAVRYIHKRNKTTIAANEDLERITLEATGPERSFIAREQFRELENAINELPYKCRLVFRLVKEDGLKYKDVAQLLEISVKTVEAHMTLAYSRIIDCLERLMPEHQRQFPTRKKTK